MAIIDIRMPPTHTDEGLRAAEEIRRRYPEVGILILSQYVEVGIATRLLSESAAGIGYLLKDRVTNLEDFTAALRRVAEGGSALDPQVVSQIAHEGAQRGRPDQLADSAGARGDRHSSPRGARTRGSASGS